jgi:hypothetical protein
MSGIPQLSAPIRPAYLTAQDAVSRARFAGLGASTGGQAFQDAISAEVLPNILRSIGRQIRFEYVVGYYYPAGSASGKRHRVTVTWSGRGRGEILGGTRTVVY